MNSEIQALTLQVKNLTSVVQGLKEAFDSMIKNQERTYTLKEFCAALNLSHQTLKKYYELYKLPITRPYCVHGQRTKFSHKDLMIVKGFLNDKHL